MEPGGQQPCGVDAIDEELGIVAEIVGGGGAKGFPRPLAIRAIGKARGVGVLGDGEGAVFAVIGEGPGQQRTAAIDIIAEGIAIGIIAGSRSADRACRMGTARAQALARRGAIAIGIDQIGIGGAQAGVIDHVIGVVIAIGPIFAGAIAVAGEGDCIL